MTIMFDRELSGPVDLLEDGTILGRIVPWHEDAEVFDVIGGHPDHYLEQWAPGAFADQARSTNRGTIGKVELVETHTGGLGKVGYALSLPERADGQYGIFRVLPRHRSDVEQILDDGFDGLSVRFHPKRGGIRVAAMVGSLERRIRTAAHMVHVALVPDPTWTGSRVLAHRDQDPDDLAGAGELVDAAAPGRTAAADEMLARMAAGGDRWSHLS